MASVSSRGKRRLNAEMNVVPYIDVMLVLLVIFMVTAPLLNQGMEVDLPESEASAAVDTEGAFIVSISKSGSVSISVGDDQTNDISKDRLYARAREFVRKNPGKAVFVRADEKTAYQHVMSTFSTLRSAGAEKISLPTEPADSR